MVDNELFTIRKEHSKSQLYILAVIVLLLLIAAPVLNSRLNRSVITIGSFEMNGGPVIGALVMVFILICVKLVDMDYYVGGRIAITAMIIQLVTALIPIIRFGVLDSLSSIVSLIVGIIICFIYRTNLRRIDEVTLKLKKSTSIDFLTGQLNRLGISTIIETRINSKEPFFVVSIDLDEFKLLNDTFGHAAGDVVLCEVSDRIRPFLSNHDRLARNAGDEFTAVLSRRNEADVESFMKAAIDSISRGILINNYTYFPTCSIGAAKYPDSGNSCDTVLRAADIAMHSAKKLGKNKYCIYNAEMKTAVERDAQVRELIRSALANDMFSVMYQPQYRASDKKLIGFEALLRMRDQNGILYSPGEFIPVAERSGQILDIDKYVLSHAAKDFATLFKGKGKDLVVNVNVSANHVSEPGFITDVGAALSRFEETKGHIAIEITEHCFLSSGDHVHEVITRLREGGLRIAIDDFGTGYASLSSLARLPFDQLKIDRSFIHDFEKNPNNRRFIKAVIDIGHSFGCEVVAEGVETGEQLELIRSLGCDTVQGFLWGEPMFFADVMKLIDKQ